MIYPPRKPGEPRRPFEIYWGRANVNAEIDGNALRRLWYVYIVFPSLVFVKTKYSDLNEFPTQFQRIWL